MPRPWYRSMLFWLGLPFPPFLAWIWWDSMQTGRGWDWVRPGRSIFFSHGGGLLRFGTCDTGGKTTSPPFQTWEWSLDSLDRLHWLQPPAIQTDKSIELVVLEIPHWTALLLYLLLWLVGLALWQRRKHRHHQQMITAMPPREGD